MAHEHGKNVHLLRRPSRECANDAYGPGHSYGPNGTHECASTADFDDVIDAITIGQFDDTFVPFGRGLVIDGLPSAERFGAFEFRVAARGDDRACASHFCELEGEDRNAAGT